MSIKPRRVLGRLGRVYHPDITGLVATLIIVGTLLVLAGIATPVLADDKMQLEISVIKGNRELPKVLYIMPWKRLPNKGVEQKLTLHSLFEDAFDPIEPESFQQHIDDYQYFVQP